MAILNDRIKEIRKKRGLTLLQLADILGVKEATVQRYESGEIKNIKYDTIVAIAKALHVHPAYLMGWADENGNSIDSNQNGILIQDPIEREIITNFRKLEPEAQKSARINIAYLHYEQAQKEKEQKEEAARQAELAQKAVDDFLTGSFAAKGGEHGKVKLTLDGLKRFIELVEEQEQKDNKR